MRLTPDYGPARPAKEVSHAQDPEQEIRDEFAQWFQEAAAKDIDGVMSHIARDALSYDHDAPPQYVGADAIP